MQRRTPLGGHQTPSLQIEAVKPQQVPFKLKPKCKFQSLCLLLPVVLERKITTCEIYVTRALGLVSLCCWTSRYLGQFQSIFRPLLKSSTQKKTSSPHDAHNLLSVINGENQIICSLKGPLTVTRLSQWLLLLCNRSYK